MSDTITPSPAAAFSTESFSDAEKADIRRFSGYPPYGGEGNTGFQGWRFYQVYGLVEFRMNNLAPAEYQNIRYRLTFLYLREAEIEGAGANLDTDKASVWTHNRAEVAHRTGLFNQGRRALCTLLGVPPGPDLVAWGGGAIVI